MTDEDLHLIFSRFGTILSCEVIRDKRTGDSLQYAFIEFEDQKACEQAYFKMQGVLIDDHRIHVDFSQSVSVPYMFHLPRFQLSPLHMELDIIFSIRGNSHLSFPSFPIPDVNMSIHIVGFKTVRHMANSNQCKTPKYSQHTWFWWFQLFGETTAVQGRGSWVSFS